MVYMKKDDYKLYSEDEYTAMIEDGIASSMHFIKLDDLIGPIISLLNKKGYRTIYSCSGHPMQYNSFYIIIEGNHINYFKDYFDNFDKNVFKYEYHYSPDGGLYGYDDVSEATTIRLTNRFIKLNNLNEDYYDYTRLMDYINFLKKIYYRIMHLKKYKDGKYIDVNPLAEDYAYIHD